MSPYNDDDETVEDFKAYQPRQPVQATFVVDESIEIAATTHPGLVRSNNEDHFAVVRRIRSASVVASSLPEDQIPPAEDSQAWIFAVADGLGGHTSGEVASAAAIRTIIDFSNQLSSWVMRSEDLSVRDELEKRIEKYAEAIQTQLSQMASLNPGLAGMATTITAIYLFGKQAFFVNVGDSRSYLIRSRQIEQVTSDHTLAEEMHQVGARKSSTGRFRNLVTRTFNTDGHSVEFDIFHVELNPDDRLLLCSDGLTDMVSDHVILQTLLTASTTEEACEKLVSAALENGGRDNVTAILVQI